MTGVDEHGRRNKCTTPIAAASAYVAPNCTLPRCHHSQTEPIGPTCVSLAVRHCDHETETRPPRADHNEQDPPCRGSLRRDGWRPSAHAPNGSRWGSTGLGLWHIEPARSEIILASEPRHRSNRSSEIDHRALRNNKSIAWTQRHPRFRRRKFHASGLSFTGHPRA